jgi:hypothetical protein
MDPKKHVEDWLRTSRLAEVSARGSEFIDIGKEEYLEDPAMHLVRLWDHFLESI